MTITGDYHLSRFMGNKGQVGGVGEAHRHKFWGWQNTGPGYF